MSCVLCFLVQEKSHPVLFGKERVCPTNQRTFLIFILILRTRGVH